MRNVMLLAQKICEKIVAHDPHVFPYSFGVLGSGWFELCLLALLVSLISLVLLFMFANFLRNQAFLTWCKFELFQIFATAGLFAVIAFFIFGACAFKLGFLDLPSQPPKYADKNMFEIVEDYFGGLQATGAILFGYLMHFAKIVGLLQRTTYISNPIGLGMEDNPLESVGQLNTIVFYMVSGFITSYLLIGLQMKMVEYMGYATLTYILPFGLFFRAFEPSRGFGGTLIGISITFLFFYPLSIVLQDYIISGQLTDVKGELEQKTEDINSQVESGKMPNAEDLKNNIGQLADTGNVKQMVNGLSNAAIFIVKPIVLYFIAAVVLPVLAFIVLVEIARSLTHILGEEIDVSNLTRLI
ncbi:MAG: hypothetical protein N3E51_03235 [Candidatus Micrarchaeota archaeon]|nr:hypothetical protein [Candidatus Micrarchaeota archaeon]